MSEVAKLEHQLDEAKAQVARMELAERLAGNSDFRKLILEYFCVEECARYAQASSDPALGPGERHDALALAQAAGHLKRFLQVQCQMGEIAARNIIDINEAIEEARAEEAA